MLSQLKYKLLNRKGACERPIPDFTGEDANELIKRALLSPDPVMIARFGAFELGMALSAQTPINVKNVIKLLRGDINSIGWNKSLANSLCNNAGFFPNDKSEIKKFSELLMQDAKEVDILASWLPGERQIPLSHEYKTIGLADFEPFDKEKPWTSTLKDKKVLVIHPYEDSIRHQWEVRDKLFPTRDFLPEFDLQIIKAVQSAAGNETKFATWFDALDYMKAEIVKRDFDIALIGCGAYGFHLAAHVKRMGKKAVHLGGVLQIMFGIMGKRWEGKYPFVNEYWIRPLSSDMIENAKTIENGCYW